MAVWQTKEDLLAQLRSTQHEQQLDAAAQLNGFQDHVLDADVVRSLLEVVAKQNKIGNSCWRVTYKGELKNPDDAESPCYEAHRSLREINNINELIRITRNNDDFPGEGPRAKHAVPSERILSQAIWAIGDSGVALEEQGEALKKDLNEFCEKIIY